MKNFLQLLMLLPLLHGSPAQSQNAIAASELQSLSGAYTGELTYLDYTSNQPATLKLTATCRTNAKSLKLKITINEWGKTYRQRYKYRFNGNTVHMDGNWSIDEKAFDPVNGQYRFVMTTRGQDGNDRKPCLFKVTIIADNRRMRISKEVLFDGETEFFLRNEYRLVRTEG